MGQKTTPVTFAGEIAKVTNRGTRVVLDIEVTEDNTKRMVIVNTYNAVPNALETFRNNIRKKVTIKGDATAYSAKLSEKFTLVEATEVTL